MKKETKMKRKRKPSQALAGDISTITTVSPTIRAGVTGHFINNYVWTPSVPFKALEDMMFNFALKCYPKNTFRF